MAKFTQHPNPICYETFGDPCHPCIVLISGLGGQLISWHDVFVKTLVARGYYVIAFDNRDSGLSHSYDELYTPTMAEIEAAKAKGETIAPPYLLEDMAKDVVRLMDSLNISEAHIVGGSMGGMIAQVFALRFTSRAKSLTCIASTSQDRHLPPPHEEILQSLTAPKPENESLAAMVENRVKTYRLHHHPDYFDEEKAREYSTRLLQRAINRLGFIRQLYAIASAKPRGEALKQMLLPSLIIHGTYDFVFPIEHAHYLKEVLPNSELVIIKNMGHGILECFCNEIAEAIVRHAQKVDSL